MILVSACLAGFNCRYNGSSKTNEKIVELIKEGKAIPVCPEQLGGLPTPRNACEINDEGKVVDKDGVDYTEQFTKGAMETLELCRKYNCDKAILKSNSPSCGCGLVYDASFSRNLKEGNGITAEILKREGIEIISSDDVNRINSL